MGPRNFDLKIAIMGVEWERMDKMEMGERANPKAILIWKLPLWMRGRMGKLEMGESGEIAMGEKWVGKGV
ncbi:uncharacterized protein Gasu_62200 [Galdieria sulphuraria]|uniref:Uncharacterized protein n=1 Tax=Galdieria sulphuraria TaxID=130081 RepID=M2X8F7_GALSU|nr:uncharacterized protein Gasu_62200 [Galdieria sulphuraria]EME26132.1 hypothetical protein Gasu_62200 [Galdieria sulphuraria]|eukprot:XP_005702652.1 hypothetical protein Gasu_62200 [Galdieria sulphuraria]